MKGSMVVSLACVLIFGTSACFAQSGIYVEFYSFTLNRWTNVPNFPDRVGGQAGLATGANISINGANGVPYRVFAVNPSNTDIASITIEGSGGVSPSLIVGQGPINPGSVLLPTPGARNIGPITTFGNVKVRLQARAETAIIGAISVYEVVRLDAPTIIGNITHNPGADSAAPILGRVEASTMGNILIRSFRGDIGTIRCTGNSGAFVQADQGSISFVDVVGNQAGGVSAPAGSILTMIVGGDLGSSVTPVIVSARDEIRRVSAGRAWATIQATGTTSTSGFLRNLATTSGGFVGTIAARRMEGIAQQASGISIAGNLDANVTFTDAVVAQSVSIAGTYPTGRLFRAGSGWPGGQSLSFTGPLAGQVILNANDGAGAWVGTASVNSVALTPVPNYTNLPATLGGGAVGLVPFNLHKTACEPAAGTAPCAYVFTKRTWPTTGGFAGGLRDTFVLRHYGPVFDGDDARGIDQRATKPLVIKRQANVVSGPPFVAPPVVDVTADFDVYVPGQPTTASLADAREVWVARADGGSIDLNFNYEIRPAIISGTTTRLKSDRTLATAAPSVAQYEYFFYPICQLESSSQGLLTWEDLPAFSQSPTDFTGDGQHNQNDVVRAVERLNGEE